MLRNNQVIYVSVGVGIACAGLAISAMLSHISLVQLFLGALLLILTGVISCGVILVIRLDRSLAGMASETAVLDQRVESLAKTVREGSVQVEEGLHKGRIELARTFEMALQEQDKHARAHRRLIDAEARRLRDLTVDRTRRVAQSVSVAVDSLHNALPADESMNAISAHVDLNTKKIRNQMVAERNAILLEFGKSCDRILSESKEHVDTVSEEHVLRMRLAAAAFESLRNDLDKPSAGGGSPQGSAEKS